MKHLNPLPIILTILHVLVTGAGNTLLAQSYPEVELQQQNSAFQFIQRSITQFYRFEVGQAELPELTFFLKQNTGDWELLNLSSRFQLSPDTIGSVNRILSLHEPLPSSMVIPNIPGLFIPDEPENDMDLLAQNRLLDSANLRIPVVLVIDGNRVSGAFFPGQRYVQQERLAFLRQAFVPPLERYRVSSPFGIGPDPFTNRTRNHQGIDLVPVGLNQTVIASARGLVEVAEFNRLFGYHVIIRHNEVFITLYAHMTHLRVTPGQMVHAGTPLGTVGMTGLATGPHLHFEIRRNDVPLNPAQYIPEFRGVR
jgi:hypothetical protein